MAGNILVKDIASSVLTVTNLHSLLSSQTWVTGWFSNSISNLTNQYEDYRYGGTFTTHASNRQAGSINVWVVASLNDTPTWPATATGTLGTEGTGSFTALEMRDCLVRLLASITVNNTASQIYTFPQTGIAQLFGLVPTHHCLYVSQNATTTTTAGLASSDSAIYVTPQHAQYT